MASTVLVVDDDRAIAQLTATWLKAAGYRVRIAHCGTDAVKSTLETPPDLILLDIRMPDMDGFEVVEQLRSTAKAKLPPVIFLSANVRENARCRAHACGAAGFLAKPYQADDLWIAAAQAIASLGGEVATTPFPPAPSMRHAG